VPGWFLLLLYELHHWTSLVGAFSQHNVVSCNQSPLVCSEVKSVIVPTIGEWSSFAGTTDSNFSCSRFHVSYAEERSV
jgi:hypothetical protein